VEETDDPPNRSLGPDLVSPVLVAELVTTASVEQLQQRFLDEITLRVDSFATGLYLHDRATGRPFTAEVRGLGNYYVQRYERFGRDEDPVVRRAVMHREVCDSDSLMPRAEWLRLPVVRNVFLPHDMARVLCAPLVIDGEVAGTLNFARNHHQPPFTEPDRRDAAVAATVFGAAVSAVRTRVALVRQQAQLTAALDRCGAPVVITDLALAQRHLNEPAAALLARLGPAHAELEPFLDCDEAGRVASVEVESPPGQRTRLTVSSHRLPDQPDVVVSTIVVDDRSQKAIAPRYRLLLTPREADVVTQVLAGLRDAQIAAELYMSPHTVKHHLKSVYAKVGVHSRVELVNRLLR
jgi:DNA-binding CsgD family transcriptional regulator